MYYAFCGCQGCFAGRVTEASEAFGDGEVESGSMEYQVTGPKWPSSGGVATVYWSIATADLDFDFSGFFSGQTYTNLIRAAMNAWEAVTNIDLVEVADSADVDIRLGWGSLGGPGNTLGVTNYRFSGGTMLETFVSMDQSENWDLALDSSGSGPSFYVTVLHEIGHALGMAHSSIQNTVMYPSLSPSVTGLTADDIAGIRSLYGTKNGGGDPDPDPEPENHAPTNIGLSKSMIAENSASGTVVGTLSATDPDAGNTHTYQIVSGAGANLFSISGSSLRVANGANLDFETQTSYTLTIRATDQGGLSTQKAFTISIQNVAVSDIALASGGQVTENAASGTVVATFSALEGSTVESDATFTLTNNAGGLFTLVGNELRVAQGADIDYEEKTSHVITIQATDGTGAARSENFTINVTNVGVDDIRLASGGSVQENAAGGTVVATFSALEGSSSVPGAAFTLVGSAGGLFTLAGNQLRVAQGAAIDYETAASYDVIVSASLGSSAPYLETFTINVGNQPISDIALAGGQVTENAAAGTVVATLSAFEGTTSESDTSYTLTNSAGGLFTLVGNQLRVAQGADIDYEKKTSHMVTVEATDGTGAARSESFTINVANVGVTLSGDSGPNTMSGTVDIDSLSGNGGNDTFIGSLDSDTINGGAGTNDKVVYNGPRGLYDQDLLSNGTITVDKPDGSTDTLTGIERIDFTDGDYIYDLTSQNTGFGYRIYQAAFDRTPDEAGVRYWIDVMDNLSPTLSQEAKQELIAQNFVDSDEFHDLYGANPSNAAYIDAMYENVLGRLPDDDGYDYWLGVMNDGASRAEILVVFTESDENVANNVHNLSDGVWVV